ncbi:glutamate [NMDA] receptor subunit 1 [Eurytemora carolleeae]|uniref:glutamate [NMDA] receptor subunit 1 n=1 Tax=Eurytemora carolleeae TaxID=1294199 RepID=UPI000C77120E|nr:glutamate [NMDA] receptor subunit 1 [Eurytemora carolleeae]|eukprot:XP_023346842.1 glutamate [NMDA] receptor subunit 1-like [Eurytemora affinis]
MDTLGKLKWKKVGALTEDGQKYSDYISDMQDDFQKKGINFVINRKFPRDVTNMEMYLTDLKERGAKVIIGDFYVSSARHVMCEAYRMQMTQKEGYVWFLPGWFKERWFDIDLLRHLRKTLLDEENEKSRKTKVEKVEEFEPGQESYSSTIANLKDCQARVYFLYATKQDAEKIFADAAEQNMTGTGYAWIVTEQALKSKNIPNGTLGLVLTRSQDEKAHIHDALHILARALAKLYEEEEDVEEAPSNCNSSGSICLDPFRWEVNIKNLKMGGKYQKLEDGRTGRVVFDAMGDRLFAEYKVMNIQPNEAGEKELVAVGNYSFSRETTGMVLSIEDSLIIWPGGNRDKPTGVMIPTHLKVLTIVERPFIEHMNNTSGCEREDGWYPCPEYVFSSNSTLLTTMGSKYCCKGYCMDLLEKLALKCNFTYDVYLSLDGDYGSLERNNLTGKQEWTGLIGELVTERADMIVAPLTINPERAQVMEFSKPFKYQGITILQKRQPRASQLVSFLQPFKPTLWVLVLVSVKVIAVCLYLLDRFSPFGRYNTDSGEVREEDSLNLTAAIWFAWGVLLNSGIGEGTPRSFSARVLGMVWAGFAMIIVASYTANLAAFLVLDKPQTSLTGINDPRLRNPMENFTYATVKGSSVDMYFRRQVELSNMYRTMEGKHFRTPELAIDAVRNGSLKAFIWDSSRLEYEAARDCDLITAGELFGRSGYGVGLQKGSPWADQVTLAILDFHESGYMERLDNKWILSSEEDNICNEKDSNSPATLGLENMMGVFILVGAGIVGGIGLILLEIIYHKHKMRKVERSEAAKVAISRWKGTVEKRKTIRESKVERSKKQTSKTNGTSIIRDNLSLSFDNLTKGSKDSRWQRVTHLVRPRSTATGLCQSPLTPRYMRSLPSAEFLRMVENMEHHSSPIAPLSVDFNKKRRKRNPPDSPDILQRCTPPPDINEGVSVNSPSEYISSDYAPVSTDGWVPPIENLPCPPPPPRNRLKSYSGAYRGGQSSVLSPPPYRRQYSDNSYSVDSEIV